MSTINNISSNSYLYSINNKNVQKNISTEREVRSENKYVSLNKVKDEKISKSVEVENAKCENLDDNDRKADEILKSLDQLRENTEKVISNTGDGKLSSLLGKSKKDVKDIIDLLIFFKDRNCSRKHNYPQTNYSQGTLSAFRNIITNKVTEVRNNIQNIKKCFPQNEKLTILMKSYENALADLTKSYNTAFGI